MNTYCVKIKLELKYQMVVIFQVTKQQWSRQVFLLTWIRWLSYCKRKSLIQKEGEQGPVWNTSYSTNC